jgi:hypothetical protein
VKAVGYVAVDAGPRATLAAIASHLPGPWLDHGGVRAAEIALLIAGTSDSAKGRQVERAARAVAASRTIPCVVVEDFPGSYCHHDDASTDLLVVESQFAADVAAVRAGKPLRTLVCPSPRYDSRRAALEELRDGPAFTRAVLWAGQPESEDCLLTLQRIVPVIAKERIPLWFRAHPRDNGYRAGAYASLFAAVEVIDVTARAIDSVFVQRPTLVATQFSSVAVEAGFWGIPALHVLLPDAGGARLKQKKGYTVPPWCLEGATFFTTEAKSFEPEFTKAMSDMQARAAVIAAFDRYFQSRSLGVPGLLKVLYNQSLL